MSSSLVICFLLAMGRVRCKAATLIDRYEQAEVYNHTCSVPSHMCAARIFDQQPSFGTTRAQYRSCNISVAAHFARGLPDFSECMNCGICTYGSISRLQCWSCVACNEVTSGHLFILDLQHISFTPQVQCTQCMGDSTLSPRITDPNHQGTEQV